MAQVAQVMASLPNMVQNFRQRLSALRPVSEMFDHQRLSRPQDLNEATARISHNTRHFSSNYAVIIAGLCVYSVLTNPLLLLAIGFLVGGFSAINRFAPSPTQIGEHVVTQKSLYTGLFVIGIPLLWIAAPLATIFWAIGSSAVVILGHAALLEPGVEAEYQSTSGIEQV